MAYLLDTNVIIDYLHSSLPKRAMQAIAAIVDDNSVLSVITQMETLGFNYASPLERMNVEIFISGSTVLMINEDIVAKTIAIRKSRKIKLPDAIIAATALSNHLTLISRNAKDFSAINGLSFIDSHSL
jgi:predicted nucleic acid-binding protein